MCGISVVIHKSGIPADPVLVKRMSDRIIHRGPDGEGYFHGPGFSFGHRRLKITDLTDEATQPMSSHGYVIIFNGEIYNFEEIRQLLSGKGVRFHSHGDTEVVLEAYRYWGKDCVQQFNGMWSFVIYDPVKNILFCSRDRFGIKPFAYFETPDRFYIGSEIKQFLDVPGFVPKMNDHAAFNFLYHSSINGVEQSFFRDVFFLSAGTNLVYDLVSHTWRKEIYYDLDKITTDGNMTYPEACREFRRLFESSIDLYSHSEVELGSCLSGGLDSTSILCTHKFLKPGESPLQTISTCFHEKGNNEIEYIDIAQKWLGSPGNKVFPDIREIMNKGLFEKITYHQDQPITGGSFFSEYKVFERARALDLKVLLSGQGADEYLAGYQSFSMYYLNHLALSFKFRKMRREAKHLDLNNNLPSNTHIKSLGYNLLLDARHKIRKSFYGIPQHPSWMHRTWFNDNLEHYNPVPALSMTGNFGLHHISKRALSQFSLPHQLHSEDRHSMMFSVESRLPFLDHRIVELSLQMPDHFKLKNGVTKRVLRDSLSEVLPEKIRQRHNKLGFPGPEGRLFEKYEPGVDHQLKELAYTYPNIFSENLSIQYRDSLGDRHCHRQLIFKALAFYNWAKAFGVGS